VSIGSAAMAVLHTVKVVAWSFIGLRGSTDAEQGVKKINPLHVIAVGLVLVFMFVGALVLFVNWVVPI